MKRPSLTQKLASLRALFAGGEAGQAASEYGLVTLLVLTTIAGAASAPFAKTLFAGLQNYLDLYFYALNLAIG